MLTWRRFFLSSSWSVLLPYQGNVVSKDLGISRFEYLVTHPFPSHPWVAFHLPPSDVGFVVSSNPSIVLFRYNRHNQRNRGTEKNGNFTMVPTFFFSAPWTNLSRALLFCFVLFVLTWLWLVCFVLQISRYFRCSRGRLLSFFLFFLSSLPT